MENCGLIDLLSPGMWGVSPGGNGLDILLECAAAICPDWAWPGLTALLDSFHRGRRSVSPL